jgi:hypothetical protein
MSESGEGAAVLGDLWSRDTTVAEMSALEVWWTRHAAHAFALPIDRAIAGGFDADRLGYAFGSGYVEAGRAMFPRFDGRGALCATEEGGTHPRAMRTTLRRDGAGYRLDGYKRFVTFGSEADVLFVVCSEGEHEGKNRLRVVAVTPRAGLVIEPLAGVPFVPEIPHAAVRFDGVALAAEEILEGDGYARYLKPFRTVEDIHVHAALLGYLHRIGRAADWPREMIEQLTMLLVALRALAVTDAAAPTTHIALDAALRSTRALIDAADFSRVDDLTRERWLRDRALLDVAGGARLERLEAARRALAGG